MPLRDIWNDFQASWMLYREILMKKRELLKLMRQVKLIRAGNQKRWEIKQRQEVKLNITHQGNNLIKIER